MDKRIKYILPKPENIIRMVNANIVENLLEGNSATVYLPELIQLAYTLVYETGALPVKDFEIPNG